jgi:hypothetical protein
MCKFYKRVNSTFLVNSVKGEFYVEVRTSPPVVEFYGEFYVEVFAVWYWLCAQHCDTLTSMFRTRGVFPN